MMAPASARGHPLTNDLPDRLRLGTRELHTAAERTPLMAALLAGRIERPVYCALLRNLHVIYEALETSPGPLGIGGPLAVFDMAALRRSDALAEDLRVLHGADWSGALPVQAAAQAYAERIRALAAAGSCALVAHAYVRYLGDLHGGQMLHRRVTQALGLSGDAGVGFYEFGSTERVLALRRGMREAIGRLVVEEEGIALVVEEARWGFGQHLRLFNGLQPQTAAG